MIYDKPLRPTFGARSDEELARILAPECVECHEPHPIAEEPAEWKLLELRDISALPVEAREALISFRKLKPADVNYICGDCATDLLSD